MERWKVEAEAAATACMCQRASCSSRDPQRDLVWNGGNCSQNVKFHLTTMHTPWKTSLHSHLKWVDVSSHIHREINYFIKYFLISSASSPLPAPTTFSLSLSKSSFNNRHWQSTDKIKHVYSLDSIVKIEIQVIDYNVCTFIVFSSMLFKVYTHTHVYN